MDIILGIACLGYLLVLVYTSNNKKFLHEYENKHFCNGVDHVDERGRKIGFCTFCNKKCELDAFGNWILLKD